MRLRPLFSSQFPKIDLLRRALLHHLNGGNLFEHFPFIGALDDSCSTSDMQTAQAAFQLEFQTLIKAWMGSGCDRTGIETPTARSLNWNHPTRGRRGVDVIGAWLGRYRPPLTISNTGEGKYFEPALPELRSGEAEEFGIDCAIYWFYILLNAPATLKFRLARCSNAACGKFYFRSRTRKKEIKRGAFCGNCKGIGSAERLRASRQRKQVMYIGLAADVWPKRWNPLRGVTISHFVIEKMRKKDLALPLKSSWVTRHRAAIEAEVERRNK